MSKMQTGFTLAGIVFAALSILPPLSGQAASRAEVLLQAAIKKEVVDGDLNGAIEAYRKIAADQSAARAVVAKALVRMGQCYERLGNTEARGAYERVVSSYPDQHDQAAEARSRLAALGGTPPAGGVTLRKYEVKAKGESKWNISADGRLFGATDYSTGNVAVIEVATGKSWNVTDYGNWNNEKGYVDQGAISRDGKQIAFWHYKYHATEGQLRVVGTDGKGERTLYRDPEPKKASEWCIPTDWSPDGRFVAMLRESGEFKDLVLVAAVDGSVRVVKSYEYAARRRPKLLFSPDGKYLAYDFPPNKELSAGDVFVMPVDGGPEVAVASHPAEEKLLAWAPDGSLLFLSDRTGASALYRVKVSGSRQAGEPELLRPVAGEVWPLGVTRADAFYYEEGVSLSNTYFASLDFETGKLRSAPRRVTENFSDANATAAWSADGRQLAYTRIREGVRTILIRPDAGGPEREVMPAARLVDSPRLRWHSDGASLLALARTETERGLFRIDARTGDAAHLLGDKRVAYWIALDWSADGRFVFSGSGSTNPASILRRDTATGEEKALAPGGPRHLRLSPDGRRIALVEWASGPDKPPMLRWVATDGSGEGRELAAGNHAWGAGTIAWTPDSKHILFVRTPGDNSSEHAVWIVPAEGGEARETGLRFKGRIHELNVHPDGARIAYTASTRKSECWVMENFLK